MSDFKIHVMTPFSPSKHLGEAYNEAMAMIPDGDWACFHDHDGMFLTPDAIAHMYKYAEMFPDALLTCYTNRVGWKPQCLNGVCSENADVRHWVQKAQRQKALLYRVTEMNTTISGYLMLFSKKLWNDCSHFTEDKAILGVDNNWSARVLNHGYKIYLMQGIIFFHTYRILNRMDKSHLK